MHRGEHHKGAPDRVGKALNGHNSEPSDARKPFVNAMMGSEVGRCSSPTTITHCYLNVTQLRFVVVVVAAAAAADVVVAVEVDVAGKPRLCELHNFTTTHT